ncbi:uncharacterized protein PAC_14371 [Phialocephala subalpina]|uniref:F-box domain-containing protein n=1 Tax=Phialocephala subalpina TaxID=576137 RepID=A0A1L7XHE4_9HELO|nr:uncharacterized protein PAC_14371 [Phialocephala subalpina]
MDTTSIMMDFGHVDDMDLVVELPEGTQIEETEAERADQTGLLMKKLPYDILYDIMKLLGPATQRLLSATCFPLHSIYKTHFHQTSIIVHRDEISGEQLLESDMIGTFNYRNILVDWLISKNDVKNYRGRRLEIMKRDMFVNVYYLSKTKSDLSGACRLQEWRTVLGGSGENAKPERSLAHWGGKAYLEVDFAKDTKEERDVRNLRYT